MREISTTKRFAEACELIERFITEETATAKILDKLEDKYYIAEKEKKLSAVSFRIDRDCNGEVKEIVYAPVTTNH